MNIRTLMRITLIAAAVAAYSQAPDVGWIKLYPKDSLVAKTGDQGDIRGHSAVETRDSGFCFTGHCCCTHCMGDMFVMRTDQVGNLQLAKRYDDNNLNEIGNSICETSDRGFIIAGLTMDLGSGTGDIYIVRIDSAGNELWSKKYGNPGYYVYEEAYSVQQTHDNGFIVAGYKSNGANKYDAYLMRLNVSGDSVWTRVFGGTRNDGGHCVRETHDRGFVLCGFTRSFGAGGSDVYLVRTDSTGNTLWSKTFGNADTHEGGYWVEETADNGFILTGYANDFQDVYLVRTDSNGTILWEKILGTDSTAECGRSVKEVPGGGFLVGGHTGLDKTSGYMIRTDALGTVMWTQIFEDSANDNVIHGILLTSDGGVAAIGRHDGEGQVQLIKLNGR